MDVKRSPGRPKTNKATRVITLRLPAELIAKIDAMAEKDGRNRTNYLSNLMYSAVVKFDDDQHRWFPSINAE